MILRESRARAVMGKRKDVGRALENISKASRQRNRKCDFVSNMSINSFTESKIKVNLECF